ncbi:copper resistance protein CopC, partial [Patulibacter sp. NPDC049589]|uniref:copper resistance protein CopC n=1 Tax=Patulibacter sp. NPDC049589 TaxID=3154731 RepID=UPI00343E261A
FFFYFFSFFLSSYLPWRAAARSLPSHPADMTAATALPPTRVRATDPSRTVGAGRTGPSLRSAAARARRRALALVVLGLLLALSAPAAASAHAQLVGAVPAGGTVVREAPQTVEFRFSEAVTATDDALRVTAPDGKRADTGAAFHPGGVAERIAVRLKGGLPQGSFTATYRVTSADGHPISNGIVFSIGRPSATATSLSGALEGTQSGPITRTFFGVVRAVQYLSIAVGIGALAFLLLVLRPAGAAGPEARRRTRRLVVAAAAAGAVSAALGVVLEGAEGAGVSLWSGLRPSVIGDGLGTRFGTVWGLAADCWILVGVGTAWLLRPARRDVATASPAAAGSADPTDGGGAPAAPADVPGGLGTAGEAAPGGVPDPPTATPAASRRPRPGTVVLTVVVALAALFLVLHPSLAGHAATQSPRAVLFVSITVHVAAIVVWVGGVVALLTVVPGLLRAAPEGARGTLLAAVAGRFSRIAIWAVAGVALSGAVQGYVLVRTPHALLDTAHGRAVLIKTLLLIAIAIVASRNHRVTVPRLRAEAEVGAATPGAAEGAGPTDAGSDAGSAPVTDGSPAADGPTGTDATQPSDGAARALRRLVRAEALLLVVVFAVTGALSTYQPAIAIPPGPAKSTVVVGPLRAVITTAPARVGVNTVRIVLTDPRTGRPFTGAKAVELAEELPGREVAALQQTATASPAEPGVYTVDGTPLTIAGRWRVSLTVRVSDFDQYDAHVDVRIRP